jgi:hypothetical protein
VRWRSPNVPCRKSENARAFPSRSECGLGHEGKRFQKLSGIDYVPATIQLAGWEPPTFDCSVDCRLGDACGRGRAARCVHIATRALCKTFLSCSYAVVKDQLSYAAEQRRSGAELNHSEVSRQPPANVCRAHARSNAPSVMTAPPLQASSKACAPCSSGCAVHALLPCRGEAKCRTGA